VSRQATDSHFSIERLFQQLRGEFGQLGVRATEVSCPTAGPGLLWLLRGLSSAWAGKAEINHIVGDVHYSALALPGATTIVTVHDLARLDQLSGIRKAVYRALYFALPLRRCACVTAVSLETARRLVTEFPFVTEKLVVVRNCVRDEFQASARTFNAVRPRVLQVGTGPNKNLENVVRALRGEECTLHIIGRLTQAQRDLLAEEGVAFENSFDVTDKQMLQAYHEADIVCFVSHCEGFGLPILEAQAVGRALITSCLAPMNETAGDGACLADPRRPDSIKQAFRRIQGDECFRAGLIKSGLENVTRYRANMVAREYVALYRRLSSRAGDRSLALTKPIAGVHE
jgi:glycosyltransferase involved in cell wall biosynthesis